MDRAIWTGLILLLLVGFAHADQIPSPPPEADEPVAEQEWLRKVYDNWQILETVTASPNGTRNGEMGEMLFFDTTTDKLCINVDGSTTWLCTDLTAP